MPDFNKRSIALHRKMKGKLEVISKVPLKNRRDLSLAYTPGVAGVCKLIEKNKDALFTHTIKANSVAVISDGSAVLGLGNIGPEGAMPVMEGKAVLFKEFAGIDAYPICLATQDTEEIIKTIKNISVGFGGINLEDISAPRCFEIEERLKSELSIPVFHDDQHGTAIVVLAALINALKVVGKDISEISLVINGAGAAATAIFNLLLKAGVRGEKTIMFDSKGALYSGREGMNSYKEKIAKASNPKKIKGNLEEVLEGADVFIGVSVGNILLSEWVEKMADKPIVFAMANPNSEISFENAKKTKIAVFGTGRSDYPNQINNVLVFPGIFRGALDARAKAITDEMKLLTAKTIAGLVSKKELNKDNIIPKPFDKRVAKAVARVVRNSIHK
jgi:malate dehydrogenase (oxaloacetate-decarboxylating)